MPAVLASRHPGPECCIFRTHKHRRCFKCHIFIIVLPAWSSCSERFSLATQTAVIFGDHDVSKCLYNLSQS